MSLENLKNRLQYRGGKDQVKRMNKDKLNSLKKALLYSYQAATAQFSDGREFKCLINPNKLSLDLDNKIISIPFKAVCLEPGAIRPEDILINSWEEMEDLAAILTYSMQDDWEPMVSEEDVENLPDIGFEINEKEEIETGIKEGDVICWKENGSHWLVHSRRLEETAYFRADIRRCRYELTLGNGSKYWVYVRGPVEQSILWAQTSGNYYNKLNYTLTLFVTQNKETLGYFNRFKKIMINDQPWEVQAIDTISSPGVIEMTLKESYNNTVETNIEKAVQKSENKVDIPTQENIYIHGLDKVFPYDVCTYEVKNYEHGVGHWEIQNESRPNMVKINLMEGKKIELMIMTGKSGSFTLAYSNGIANVTELNITVGSL